MIIKKYTGKTEEEAVETAKKELGPGVVIMSARQVKKKGILGFLSAPVMEVTVALEDENEKQPPKAPTMTALEHLAAKQREINEQKKNNSVPAQPKSVTEVEEAIANVLREDKEKEDIVIDKPVVYAKSQPDIIIEDEDKTPRAIEEKLDSIETLIKKKLDSVDSAKANTEEIEEHEQEDEQMKLTRLLYNMMIDNEVREKYANQIIEEAQKQTKPNMPVDVFLTTVYQKMILKFGHAAQITEAVNGPKVVFFIGPTGVGKTTTIAKIASKFCLEEKKVALLTSDTYRIAAAEQLKTYANILSIPCEVTYSAEDIVNAYNTFENYDYIFVDTAGHSHHNEEQKNNTNVVIHALDGKAETEVYLVISATTKYKDLTSIADTYREMSDYKIIFTKLDETTSFGNLLNLKLYTESELSYVTYGQNVPNDISRFDPQTIVKQILGGNKDK